MQPITPVILSGGSGSRLWPMSRAAYPKQFLALSGEQTLIQQAAMRVRGAGYAAPIIVSNEDHRFVVAEQLRQIGCEPAAILLEPVGRNTAPAVAIAALQAEALGHDLILVMPSDHVIRDQDAFDAAIHKAAQAAHDGALVTFGITPDQPETGYGYIRAGAELDTAGGVHKVAAFVEKPNRETAEAYLAGGDYLWNSGIFLFSARTYLEELKAADPDMLAGCEAALKGSTRDLTFCRLDKAAFAAVRSDSIDYAVMEKTQKAAVVPVDMGWSDLGAWSALWEIGDKDDRGNV
ncbi:MAG: mannose-1-phosphate guanylyltransferase/mannose-6-phosphate isomerase, partial [Asticcacaulis sp.]